MGLLNYITKAMPLVLCAWLPCAGGVAPSNLADGVDRSDPNFVKASLWVVEPGDTLYSCFGHASLRLECPHFKLDNCFTYEAEPVAHQVARFFAGDLKMGLFAVPAQEMIDECRKNGRGIKEYPLNLPPNIKQRLWQIMDEKVAASADLSYDYINRSCAQTLLRFLFEAIGPAMTDFHHAPWPEKYKKSRREILADYIDGYPWTRFFLHIIVGYEGDLTAHTSEKVVIPEDLKDFLAGATLYGKPLLTDEARVIVPYGEPKRPPLVTPMVAAVAFVAVAIANLFVRTPYITWMFLSLLGGIGAFLTYMIGFSNLPATGWNWLLIPFNPLPLILWKWCEKWSVAYVVMILAWIAFMYGSPHALTDPALPVVALAYAFVFFKETPYWNRFLCANKNKEQSKGERK